jgi:preprotein translocase subunit SecF
MDERVGKSLIMFGIAAIFAVLAIVLLVVTPFFPDEAVAAMASLAAGFQGVVKLLSSSSD